MAKSPYNLIIHPLIKPQVANQQKNKKNNASPGPTQISPIQTQNGLILLIL